MNSARLVTPKSASSKKHVTDAYMANVNKKMKKRKVPQTFYKDPESMYMDIQELKLQLLKIKEENTKLRTNLQKTESGSVKKQKQVEELLRTHSMMETKGQKYETLFKEVNVFVHFCVLLVY